MTFLRARALALLLLLAVIASSCERIAVGPEIARELRRGRSLADSLAAVGKRASRPEDISAETAVALGYLERLRLGLGSPFRLVDYALRDPRLPDSSRARVGWALLARTLDGDDYQVDPAVLTVIGGPAGEYSLTDGRAHLRLIEDAVAQARDPRGGEMAVRLAYALAATDHSVGARAPLIAARVAALLRDRELARQDARLLLHAARREQTDPLALLPVWRAERRFRVELPAMMPVSARAEREAMDNAATLAERIGAIDRPREDGEPSQVGTSGEGAGDAAHAAVPAPRTLLGYQAATRLADIARATHAPPQAPVVVAIAGYRGRLLGAITLPAAQRVARERFVARATNEETLVAERALLAGAVKAIAPELATLSAAVSLRTYGQEEPWLVGDAGPTAGELRERFGISAVTFDASVPDAWKPYYRSQLASALADLTRVLPTLKLAGLRVHFGESSLRSAALAMHDPQRRIVFFPIATSAGAIAHEIAHDVDWQVARTRYAMQGDYATDRAVRERRGRLAVSMRGLAAASPTLGQPDPAVRAPLSQRPTEVFARGVDWFVAVSLAREGRTNGYLSSVQDDLLTGYVSVTPPDVSGQAGWALVNILDDVAPAAAPMRDWFLARYGPGRALTPYDLVRRVLEAPLASADSSAGSSLVQLVTPVLRARDTALTLIDADQCARTGGDQRALAARRRLVLLAASARASGIMREQGTVLAMDEARRWLTLAPYAAAQPFVFAGALGSSAEASLADQATSLSLLQLDAKDALVGRQSCAPAISEDGAG